MIVLAIDPGFSVTGYAVLKKEGGKVSLLDYGALKMSATKSLSERVGIFYKFFTEKILHWKVTIIALETSFLGKNAQNFLKLGYLRGILYLLADIHRLGLHEFAPREVKLSVTGSGAADKEQVARVILRLFPGVQKPDKLDITDALAVGVCSVWKNSLLLNC